MQVGNSILGTLVFAPEEQHVYSLGTLDKSSLRQERHAKCPRTLRSYGAPVCHVARSYKHAAPPEQSSSKFPS